MEWKNGRNARGILEYAKTITWFDYLFNEAKKLKHLNITNDYKFYKLMYSILNIHLKINYLRYLVYLHLKNHGKESTEKNIPGATCIIQHPIWDIENTKFTSIKL